MKLFIERAYNKLFVEGSYLKLFIETSYKKLYLGGTFVPGGKIFDFTFDTTFE